MKKTIMAVILTAMMIVLTCIPVYAEEASVNVTANTTHAAGPTFQVSVSPSVSLSNHGTDTQHTANNIWSGSYTVTVTSNDTWSSGKYVTAGPKASSFILKGTNNSSEQYTASVSQQYKYWVAQVPTSNNANTPVGPNNAKAFNSQSTGNISVSIPATANDIFTGTFYIEYSSNT